MNKHFLVLLFCGLLIAVCESSSWDNDDGGDEPDLQDSIIYQVVGMGMNKTDLLKQQLLAESSSFNVSYYLFTSDNPSDPQILEYNNSESVHNSNFDPNNPTRFIVHGWLNDNTTEVNIKIREAYMNRSDNNFNIIVMDWSEAAQNINYILASFQTKAAGYKLANFIKFLVRDAMLDLNETYLIGHSLGAHVVGFAGKQFQEKKINTIFGLDPAKPLFVYSNRDDRLAIGDAQYVESIHSDGGILGQRKPIGNASFYPNWGILQPGCSDITTSCSHARSFLYFAESLMNPNMFFARQCRNYAEIVAIDCIYTCKTAYMGGDPSNNGKNVHNIYYLPVKSKYPFAVGTFS